MPYNNYFLKQYYVSVFMKSCTKPIYPHETRSFAGMDELVELALDLRWSWDHGADNIWRPLSPELWDLTRNPWIILQTVGPGKLKELADNQEFRSRVKKLSQKSRTSRNAATWFQKEYAHAGLTRKAGSSPFPRKRRKTIGDLWLSSDRRPEFLTV